METSISYYAIFKNGTYSPLHNLQAITALPQYSFILRVTTIYKGGSFDSTTYEFVNSKDELENLKLGDWELTFISQERYKSTYTSYNLYNHQSESCETFKGYKFGPEFIKEELFPKLMELCNIPDYDKYLVNKRISALEEQLKVLQANVKSQQKDKSSEVIP